MFDIMNERSIAEEFLIGKFNCDGAKAFALRSAEDAIDDFTLNQVAEKWNVVGGVQKVDRTESTRPASRKW